MKNMKTNFKNASEAFDYFNHKIKTDGVKFDDTIALFNVGFTMEYPKNVSIASEERNFHITYAEAEWQWYLSGDPSLSKLKEIYGKVPYIWEKMQDSEGKVRSNYGWQWMRNGQLDNAIHALRNNSQTRQAAISIYDGKENDTYQTDTPCTYAVQFTILNERLNMSVYMRSNDLWYGFCNDQYCFSKLQQLVARELSLPVGTYYHHAHNLHLYNNKL
jgi:thymidylate synthase